MGERRVHRAVVVALLLAFSCAAMAGQGTASAIVPATGFDADLEEDGDVQLCNPEGVRYGLYLGAIVNLNADTSLLPGADPAYVDVTGTGEFCEAEVQRFDKGADAAPLARWNYRIHPDGLQLNVDRDKFPSLNEGQELATITHEMAHGGGLDHPPSDAYWCRNAVISTYAGCRAIGEPRRTTPGPEDVASFGDYWDRSDGGDGPYPVPNKCWDDTDADGDGVCDRFGPPIPPGSPEARRAGGAPAAIPAPGMVED
jgi:hypothetical protein